MSFENIHLLLSHRTLQYPALRAGGMSELLDPSSMCCMCELTLCELTLSLSSCAHAAFDWLALDYVRASLPPSAVAYAYTMKDAKVHLEKGLVCGQYMHFFSSLSLSLLHPLSPHPAPRPSTFGPSSL